MVLLLCNTNIKFIYNADYMFWYVLILLGRGYIYNESRGGVRARRGMQGEGCKGRPRARGPRPSHACRACRAAQARLTAEALEDAQEAAAAGQAPPGGSPLDGLDPKSSGEAMQRLAGRPQATMARVDRRLSCLLSLWYNHQQHQTSRVDPLPLLVAVTPPPLWLSPTGDDEPNEGGAPAVQQCRARLRAGHELDL